MIDIDIIKNIQLKLYKIRISEYLNKYGVFLNLNSIKNIANNVDYFDWASPLYNSECLKIWTTCVKPWNYIQYYEETKLKDFRQFMTSFRNYIIKRCSINIQSVIKQAESNGHNKTWAINIFEKWVKMIIDDSLRDYKKNIHSHLQKYKKSKIEECVYNAIKDCQLKAIDKIWNSSPQIEVHIIENAVMANSEIQIYIKYSIKDTIKMIFLFPSPMNDNPFDEMIVIPTEYIKWAVNKRRSWGTWVNISVENNEKEKKLLNDTLDWYQDIALMSIIYYLDYDYIKLYERYSMNSEDNSTTNICSNSIDSDSWSEKGLDNLIGNYAEYP